VGDPEENGVVLQECDEIVIVEGNVFSSSYDMYPPPHVTCILLLM
jgi:hypothetical protein